MTILSAASMVYAVVQLPFYLLSGLIADALSPVIAVGTLGGIISLVSIVAVSLRSASVGEESDAVEFAD